MEQESGSWTFELLPHKTYLCFQYLLKSGLVDTALAHVNEILPCMPSFMVCGIDNGGTLWSHGNLVACG